MRNGDIVNVDVTVYYKGFHADLNETYLVGECDEDSKKLLNCAYNALQKAIELCKPGTLYKQIGNAITKYVESRNMSVVKTYCGHGIGDLFHCNPNVPHYSNNKAIGSMKVLIFFFILSFIFFYIFSIFYFNLSLVIFLQ